MPSGALFPPGTTIVTVTATDASGNATVKQFNVTVTFCFNGFLQPINSSGNSVFKLGSTIPVKFKLCGASSGIQDLIARIWVAKVTDGVLGNEEEGVSTSAATEGNLFRYSSTDDQYIFNLSTKPQAGFSQGTWQIRADLGDGVQHVVIVSIKK
jgi:hypothetical protein